MADEPITQPTPTPETPKEPSRAEERITQLSDKVRQEAEGREKAEREKSELQRERDFYAGFSDVVATNPAAKDHKDDILSKVKSGYTVEDATYAVLGKAGKLGAQPQQPVQNPAGGSAPNAITQSAEKPVAEMSQDERRAALAKELIWQ